MHDRSSHHDWLVTFHSLRAKRIDQILWWFWYLCWVGPYIFGFLLKNPTAGKFLIFGFAGIFIYEAVKDAGLLASAAFLAGVISHHITPFSILESLPRLSLGGRGRRDHPQCVDRSRRGRGNRKSRESADETSRRYEEYQERNKAKDAKAAKASHDGNPHHRRGYTSRNPDSTKKQPERDAGASKAADELQREKARLKREQDRLKTEREQLEREQQERKAPPDNRTDEEILGVKKGFTLAKLKSARNSEARGRDEKINFAYERLVRIFR